MLPSTNWITTMPFKQSDAGSTPAGSTNLCHCQNGFNSLYSVATGEVSGNDIEFMLEKFLVVG